MQDRGYSRKSNYLEEVLRSSQKMEAKLIGYDENPIDITASCASDKVEILKIQEPVGSNFHPKINSMSKPGNICRPHFVGASKQPPSHLAFVGAQHNETIAYPRSDTDPPATGLS